MLIFKTQILLIVLISVKNSAAQQKCTAAPLPPTAQGNANLPGKNYYSARVVNNVYWKSQFGVGIMFVVTNTGVVITDAPPGQMSDTVAAIREVTQLPITHMIYSHMHCDHICDSSKFGNVTRIAHVDTYDLLAQANDPTRPLPTITFTDSLTMVIGGTTFQFDYKGPIHKSGNILVWLPNERVLHSVDMLTPGWAFFIRMGLAPDVPTTLKSMDVLLAYPFLFYIPGHSARLGTRQDMETTKEYFRDVQTNAITAINQIQMDQNFLSRFADPTNSALTLVELLKARIDMCSKLTVPKWLTRLGAADVYTPSNCDAVIFSEMLEINMRVI